MTTKKEQITLFSELPLDYRKDLQPGRTAIPRRSPSPIARGLNQSGFLLRENIKTILDFGCGIGKDVEYYKTIGISAVGYDQHEPYGFVREPSGVFDLVTCLFVLNVISAPADRMRVCEQLLGYTKVGGIILVATRSVGAIAREATMKGWDQMNDGFLSSPSKGTFQKGIDADEIFSLFPIGRVNRLNGPVKSTTDAAVCMMRTAN